MSLRRPFFRAALRYGLGPRVLSGSETLPVQTRRATLERLALGPGRGFSVESAELGGVPCDVIRRRACHSEHRLLYFHGGAYCIGSSRTHAGLAGGLSVACEMPVVLPNYRLAPEAPHPAALDDAIACYRALHAERAGGRILVGGDSAGGGLAAALALKLRDEGDPLPEGLVLISPWTDLSLSGRSIREKAKVDPVLRPDTLAMFARLYLQGRDARDPYVSPLFGDLSGLPPVLIHVGEDEILLDDAKGLAEGIRARGGMVSLRVEPDLWHVWHALAGFLPEADAAIAAIGATCREWVR